MVIGLILFFILGLAAGYAITGAGAWFVLAVPLLFAILTASANGIDGRLIVVLLVALGVTGGAVLVGRLIDRQLSTQS